MKFTFIFWWNRSEIYFCLQQLNLEKNQGFNKCSLQEICQPYGVEHFRLLVNCDLKGKNDLDYEDWLSVHLDLILQP